jgi:hypothetical protein
MVFRFQEKEILEKAYQSVPKAKVHQFGPVSYCFYCKAAFDSTPKPFLHKCLIFVDICASE